MDVFALCLSQNSVFAGSLNKLAATRSTTSGFMHSIAEIQAITSSGGSQVLGFQNRKIVNIYEHGKNEYKLPSMPPWFITVDSQKLYQSLSGILRLVSLYMFSGWFFLVFLPSNHCVHVIDKIILLQTLEVRVHTLV